MSSDTLKLYITPEHPCSYLPGQQTKSLFVDPDIKVNASLYSQLNYMGFRRSGKFIYKPNCANCSACQSCRVAVNDFSPSRSQKRIIKRNQHLHTKQLSTEEAKLAYPLYEKYINTRHQDGDMYPANEDQYTSFLLETLESTCFVGFYDADELVCVAIIDFVASGLSALYTFFEPSLTKNAFGVNAILWQIEECKRRNFKHLYLGYLIEDCDKMNYKKLYQPLEVRIKDRWQAFKANNWALFPPNRAYTGN